MAERRLNILVVDDHPLFRSGFVAAWRRQRSNDLVLEAGSFADAVQHLGQRAIDILVADLGLPDRSGLELCRWVREAAPATTTVVLTTHDAPAIIAASRGSGARGFFGKDLAIQDLIREIDRLMASSTAVSFPSTAAVPFLTTRERQVLGYLMKGETNPAIATALGVSGETVKSHVGAIFHRLGATNRFHAVELARAMGFDIALPHLGDDNEKH
jgi:DNA-binding NarL/FixJ family response regulator